MKKHLLKAMLVGVMTLVASSGWAQTVTTYDFEDGNALFTADSRISASVVEGTQTIYNQDFELDGKAVKFTGASNAQNGYCFAHYDFSSLCDQAAKVKVEFDAVLGNGARSIISVGDASVRGNTGNSTKTTYSNKGAIFRVGTDKNYSYVNGSNVGSSTVVSQKWLKVTIEVDEVAKNYTYSIVNKATEEVLFSNGEEPVAFYSSDATNCTQIDMFGYINNSQMGLIDNLIITVTKDERQQANYTVNFLDTSNNPIKDAVTRSGAVGDPITLLPADKEPLWDAEGTQKYIYQSDNAEGKTIEAAGTTAVNVVYRDAEVYNYTLLSSLGTTLTTGSGFEGESPRVAYPRYQLDGTDLYMAAVDNKEYRTTVNLTENNVSKTINYTLQEGKVAAFYTEAEDIEGITVATNDNIPVRASNAKAATTTDDVTITTLAPGKYILHVGIFTSKSNYSGLAVNFGVGEEVFSAELGAVNLNEKASEEYVLNASTAISYLASSSADTQFDYIWIEKTGDVEVIPVDITIANASFEADGEKAASNGALELTGWTFSGVGTQFNNTEIRAAGSASTTSQFGTSAPSDGDYALFFRQGWNGSGNTINLTSAAIAEIPAGAYVLSVDYKQHYSYDNSPNNNTFVGLSLMAGEATLATGKTASATGVNGGTADATYFNDAEWSTLEVPFTLTESAVDAQIVITLNAGGQRRSDFFIDNVKLISVPGIELAKSGLKKAIEAAQDMVKTYTVGEGLFMYAASEIKPLEDAIATAQTAYTAAESKETVEGATETLNTFVSTFAPKLNTPDSEKAYTLKNKQSDLYMTLSAEGISIADTPCALKFEAAENGKFYITDDKGELYVGLAGTDNWSMSSAAEKKEALAISIVDVEGAFYYTLGESKGLVGVDYPKKDNKGCWANKATSDGDAVLWTIEVADATTVGISTLNSEKNNGAIFNLNGQKVNKAQKGLYIINGKKVLVK